MDSTASQAKGDTAEMIAAAIELPMTAIVDFAALEPESLILRFDRPSPIIPRIARSKRPLD
jgi:hypothetical protein